MVSADSLRQHFPWGWLLLTDSESNEELPSSPGPDPVLAGNTYVLVQVLHGDEGKVSVHVGAGPQPGLTPEFSGSMNVPSGRLRIGDLLGEVGSIEVDVPSLTCAVTIAMDTPTHAEAVGITLA